MSCYLFESWQLWAGLIGIVLEFVGLLLLAYELVQTNKNGLAEATLLAEQKSLFNTLLIDEGTFSVPDSGKVDVQGGIIGYLLARIPVRQQELSRSRRIIVIGVLISGTGVVFQIGAGIIQASCS